eukprot:6132540-Pleurochrysis_carterae.AAC.1
MARREGERARPRTCTRTYTRARMVHAHTHAHTRAHMQGALGRALKLTNKESQKRVGQTSVHAATQKRFALGCTLALAFLPAARST